MSLCIVENQSAFVGGGLISDNVIVAHELFHYLKGSKNGSNKGVAIKLDMENACDRVEWNFLSDIMAKMGYALKWIDTVMTCVATVSYCFKMNGAISYPFRPSIGLRQGDPLSPYLFLFCTHGLSALLIKEQREGHLYSRNGTSDQSKAVLNLILNVREDAITGQYLGLPLIVGNSKVEAFGLLDEKVHKRMGNWTKNLLSFAGREVFIKSVAQGIYAYAMSCLLLLDCTINPMLSTTRKSMGGNKPILLEGNHVENELNPIKCGEFMVNNVAT
ncbi:hypothetical protein GQ457_11G024750 [Hibiscus cannabinus]